MSILFLILQFIQIGFGQGKKCSEIDSNLCYIKEKYPTSEFAIEKKWESEDDVLQRQTLLLADLDGDCIPELLVGGINGNQFWIYIINPISGKTIKKINMPFFNYHSPMPFAVADVDNDGTIEIVIAVDMYSPTPFNLLGKLVCLNLDETIKWISDQRYDIGQLTRIDGTPAFADFNQDGIPEVYIHNLIFNAQTGVKLADGGNNGIGKQLDYTSLDGTISVAAQLDEDSTDLELAAGYTVYKVSIKNPNGMVGNSMVAHNILVDNELRDGFASIADINNDGRLDIIVASSGLNDAKLYCYTINNGITSLLAKIALNDIETRIGPPLIGDINGTGQLSILTVRPNKLMSFSYNGSLSLSQEWKLDAQDISGFTALTLFDLNNDGNKEIIYRDEGFLRIINVDTNIPKELAKIFCPVTSLQEGPIVGDIDNSGHSKICVTCALANFGNLGKLAVFAPPDSLPGWAPARGIWNQYAYNPLFINDDLTVPQFQKNQATYKNGKYNNFMQQESYVDSNGMVRKSAASLTGQIKCVNYDPITNEYIVVFDLYNRKDASNHADSNLAVSFYNGDPTSSGTLIGIYYTLKSILAGDSLLNLEYRFSALNPKDLFMVVNTIRNGSGVFDDKDFTQAECDYTDNISRTLELPKLDSIQAKICKGASFQFLDTTIQDSGMYYRKLSTINGCDSLIYILNLSTVDTIYIKQSVKACDVYSWNNKLITQSGTYVFDTLNQFGCDSIISLDLIINKSSVNKTQHTACDSYTWNGQTYDKSGFYT
ncbi:MAG: VCBS repeat-containing protein, partial [Saprospiraceae bacterium]